MVVLAGSCNRGTGFLRFSSFDGKVQYKLIPGLCQVGKARFFFFSLEVVWQRVFLKVSGKFPAEKAQGRIRPVVFWKIGHF